MTVRRTLAVLEVNGAKCPVISAQVTQTRDQQADTLRATLSSTACNMVGRGPAFWLQEDKIALALIAGAGPNAGELFRGEADSADISFDGTVIQVSGRDKSKGLMDNKSTEGFLNKTADEIVGELGGRRGLKVDAGKGQDKAGKVYSDNFMKLTDHMSEWSVIQHLADREGKVAYVRGDTLHFKEIDDDTLGEYAIRFTQPTLGMHATSNVLSLSVRRNITLAKKTKVKVGSWASKKKDKNTGEAEHQGGSNGTVEHVYRHANLTKEQAEKIAKKRLREHVRHELEVNISAPGRATVNPELRLRLSGTGTAADQLYYIDRVEHDIGDGYLMSITARNTRGGK